MVKYERIFDPQDLSFSLLRAYDKEGDLHEHTYQGVCYICDVCCDVCDRKGNLWLGAKAVRSDEAGW